MKTTTVLKQSSGKQIKVTVKKSLNLMLIALLEDYNSYKEQTI